MDTREFFVQFLERCQTGESVLSKDGQPKGFPIMTKEEADLRLALFDNILQPTLDIEIELAQYEAMRWPQSKMAQARLWKLLEERKNQN